MADEAGPTRSREVALTPSIVKFGGSVLTRKRGSPRLRPKVLERLAAEVVSADHPVLLLHGAGSFGHPMAKRFGLNRPPREGEPAQRRARGAAIVSAEVRRLHQRVLAALLDAGGRPWSIPPAALAMQHEGTFGRLDDRPFREAIAAGAVPVSFGDVVLDDAWGFSIVSGDTLAVELARRLGARRVVFVSDVEGIYALPGGGRRSVVETVTQELVHKLGERTTGPDVTGGIRGKAEAMIAIARSGRDAGLISGLTDGALSRALRGEPVFGSWSRAGTP